LNANSPHKERPLTRLRFPVRGSARRSQAEVRCLSHSQTPVEEGDKGSRSKRSGCPALPQ
jgi:hypothetical protein